jgi:hypothetical protein
VRESKLRNEAGGSPFVNGYAALDTVEDEPWKSARALVGGGAGAKKGLGALQLGDKNLGFLNKKPKAFSEGLHFL